MLTRSAFLPPCLLPAGQYMRLPHKAGEAAATSLLSADQQAAALEQAVRPATITASNNSGAPQPALLQRLPAVQTWPYQLLSTPCGTAGSRSPRRSSRRHASKEGRAADDGEDSTSDCSSDAESEDAEGDSAGGSASRNGRSRSMSQAQHVTVSSSTAAQGGTSFWGVKDARAAAATAAAAVVSSCGRPAARWAEDLQVAVGLQQLVQQDALLLVELLQPPRWGQSCLA